MSSGLIVAAFGIIAYIIGIIWYELNVRNRTKNDIWTYVFIWGGVALLVIGCLLIAAGLIVSNSDTAKKASQPGVFKVNHTYPVNPYAAGMTYKTPTSQPLYSYVDPRTGLIVQVPAGTPPTDIGPSSIVDIPGTNIDISDLRRGIYPSELPPQSELYPGQISSNYHTPDATLGTHPHQISTNPITGASEYVPDYIDVYG